MHLESNINYPHSRITATENKLYKNYLIESTITQSHEGSGPIDHKYAENIVRNVNISNSNSSFVNAVYVISGNTDLDAIVSFSTFVKNIANSLRCLLNYENGIRINRCSIISNECSLTTKDFNGVISASPNVKLSVTDCIILNNKGYALFCARKDGSITVSSCFIPSNTYKSYTQSVRGNANFDISTTGSFNIKNSHFSTALCYADFLFCSLTQITTDKTKYKIRQDTTITGTVSFDQNKEESFTLEIWIDNYPSTKLSRSSGSSTYQYSINIPSGLSIGNHKIYSKFSDENTLRSNIVSAEFQYLNAFSLNLNDLEKTDYNKTIDKYIKVQGSGVYSEEFSIKCSIGGILSTFNGIPNKNPETYTFDFSGTCLIPDSIAEEKKIFSYSLGNYKSWRKH
ncbi:hypothetical protein TVAG_105820 [Trichomonas vaginalis G3]|uniref:Uncharacterized protein n=1 Tax=Trichomonas vaginalis (strain ATCC PRA-98 / G3) TaxID=412133 RepID=A2FLS1_TRIV3|nr:hypothetical protein TVAGG3_0515260 [Trichomonas vaginalis G3]EAX94163.1 hypothetical protein TVAG_105820 [Trichomonas vaginalis G3]KAI5518070.1 hypothetical protein TVAGG3_0515260 [Trichomonas vaginalis G3]|eukprot:XP_001307093.1 hypothetical protein [Trichomonas vaginalis G3]